jgi:hypothetical protein
MIDYIYALLILISGSIIISSLLQIIQKIRNYFKIITRYDIVNNYFYAQEIHRINFKQVINNELKKYIKTGKKFPIYVTYEKVFSEDSLDVLRSYISNTLKFEDFELEQKDQWVVCQLILKG